MFGKRKKAKLETPEEDKTDEIEKLKQRLNELELQKSQQPIEEKPEIKQEQVIEENPKPQELQQTETTTETSPEEILINHEERLRNIESWIYRLKSL